MVFQRTTTHGPALATCAEQTVVYVTSALGLHTGVPICRRVSTS